MKKLNAEIASDLETTFRRGRFRSFQRDLPRGLCDRHVCVEQQNSNPAGLVFLVQPSAVLQMHEDNFKPIHAQPGFD